MAHEIPAVELAPGVGLPTIGFGTWQITGKSAYSATRTALDVGYRHIDTATMYGNEEEIGRALRDSGLERSDIFITTKLPPSQAGRERQTIEASLKALGVDFVDLWLIHWPPSRGKSLPTWISLLEQRDAGRIRSAGVSNYDTTLVDELIRETGETPVVNQVELHPYFQQVGLRREHGDLGIVTEAWSPLAQGAVLEDPVIVEIAKAHGKSPGQVVIRWHLQLGNVVIPKSVTQSRIEENIDVFGFTLTDEQMAAIDGLDRGHRTGPDPDTFN
jgi:2,5-diketo-D-gluconate reductase A